MEGKGKPQDDAEANAAEQQPDNDSNKGDPNNNSPHSGAEADGPAVASRTRRRTLPTPNNDSNKGKDNKDNKDNRDKRARKPKAKTKSKARGNDKPSKEDADEEEREGSGGKGNDKAEEEAGEDRAANQPASGREEDEHGFGLPTNPLASASWSLMAGSRVPEPHALVDKPHKLSVPVRIEASLADLGEPNDRKRPFPGEGGEGEGDGGPPNKRRHNAVEQRRRDKINTRITELRHMLPVAYHSAQEKAPKAQVLSDVIVYVQDVQARLRQLGVRDLIPEGDIHPRMHSTPTDMMPPAVVAAVAAAAAGPGHVMEGVDVLPSSSGFHADHQAFARAAHMFSPGYLSDKGLPKRGAVHISKAHLQQAGLFPHQDHMPQGEGEGEDKGDHGEEGGSHEHAVHSEGQYSSEILRLLLSATGKDVGGAVDIDPFGLGGYNEGAGGEKQDGSHHQAEQQGEGEQEREDGAPDGDK